MLKVVALYLCVTIFLVSGNANISSTHASASAPVKSAEPISLKEPSAADSKEPTLSPDPPQTTSVAPETEPPPKPDTTTKAAETTTTTKPTTTTTTTTTKPTTTTTTTTTVPPTTTKPTPTPTPAPAPAPTPKTGQWSVNGTNGTCIVVKMAVSLNVIYYDTKNQSTWKRLTLPNEKNETIATGCCGLNQQMLNLTWNDEQNSLIIHFTKNDTTKKYFTHHVEVSIGSGELPGMKPNTTLQLFHEGSQFSTTLKNSYKCARLQNLTLTREGENVTSGWFGITDLQLEAFKSDNTTNFGTAEDCSPDVPDIVPIVVGCILTLLVIAVLAAYLIGRKCTQSRGYLSM